jgi:hypothetical protein
MTVLKIGVVTVVNVFHRSVKTGAGDACFLEKRRYYFKRQIYVLDAAVYVAVDYLHVHHIYSPQRR